MRIIAGDFKGRKLYSPKDNLVRPTTDKVKEALFSIINSKVYDAIVCDLFAGTGNLGLEAISRGAEFCYFADHSSESIKLIRDNVAMCRGEESSEIIHGDYGRALDKIDQGVDIFLLDPPYKKDLFEKVFSIIKEKKLLNQDGIIVAEHYKDLKMPETLCGFTKTKEKGYGTVVLSIYM